MSEAHSLETIAETILAKTPPQFKFLLPQSLQFTYTSNKGPEPPYYASLTGQFTNVRQAQFDLDPIDHLHVKALPFMCEQLAYVLAAKLILDKNIPGLEHMTLADISREKKEILRAAKVTYPLADIPMSDTTIFEGFVGLQDKPFLPTPGKFYTGRMDVALFDSKCPQVQTRANYHVVRMHK